MHNSLLLGRVLLKISPRNIFCPNYEGVVAHTLSKKGSLFVPHEEPYRFFEVYLQELLKKHGSAWNPLSPFVLQEEP